MVDELEYQVKGHKEVTVTGYKRKPTSLTIPAEITYNGEKYKVKSIGSEAFYKCSSLTTLNLPVGLQTIAYRAFEGCKFLTEVNLPVGLQEIESYAFSGCSSLTTLNLPVGLQRIENDAFSSCQQLTFVSFPPTLKEIGGNAFLYCYALTKIEGLHKDISYYSGNFRVDKKIESLRTNFSFRYIPSIYHSIEQWQQKKSFETADQWRTRVSSQNRARKLQQFVNEFKEQYISERSEEITKYRNLKFTISDYDEDFHTYTLNEARFTACYVQVPQTEREYFKNNFSTAKITPTYSVKDDTLAIVALTVQIGQKTYKTPQDVADDGSTLAMELPPLEFNLNQEQGVVQPKVAT